MGGEQLYSEAYSQYGPFYFLVQEFWFRLLNLPITHDSGRIVTLVHWIVSALLGGAVVYRLRQDLLSRQRRNSRFDGTAFLSPAVQS